MTLSKLSLKEMVADAYQLKSQTFGTQVVFNVYAGAHYILDTEEDNIIDVVDSEEDAKDACSYINGCYYKPILIDEYSGERITRKNIDLYKK